MLEKETTQKQTTKFIEGYTELYTINTKGEVFSYYTNKFLKPAPKPNGYLTVVLIDSTGKRKTHTIHRLVAQTFIPNMDDKLTVDHKDRDKLNNEVSNLRWVDRFTQQSNRSNSKPVEYLNLIHTDGRVECYFDGFANKHNISSSDIRKVLRGERKSCRGWSIYP